MPTREELIDQIPAFFNVVFDTTNLSATLPVVGKDLFSAIKEIFALGNPRLTLAVPKVAMISAFAVEEHRIADLRILLSSPLLHFDELNDNGRNIFIFH